MMASTRRVHSFNIVRDIRMTDQKILTKEIAEQYIADQLSVDTSEFTAIDDDAAAVLGEGCCGTLDLGEIHSISDAAAHAVLRVEGKVVLGIRELTDSIAQSIAEHKGAVELVGIEDITDRQAEILASGTGDLELMVSKLSENAAKALAKHTGGTLSLPFLETLSSDAAEALSQHKCLELGSFCELTSAGAIKLTMRQEEVDVQSRLSRVTSGFRERCEYWIQSHESIASCFRFKDLLSESCVLRFMHNDLGMSCDELLSRYMDDLSVFECGLRFDDLEIDETLAKRLASFQASCLDLRKCLPVTAEVARILVTFPGDILIELHRHDNSTRQILNTHRSLQRWCGAMTPSIEHVCINCGTAQRIEFPEYESNVYGLFGNDHHHLCWDCRHTLTEEQIALAEKELEQRQ